VIENLSFDNLLKSEAGDLIAVSGNKNNDLLSLRSGADKSRLFKLGLEPGDEVSHPPILIDGKLVVASKRGQIAKIDADSGQVDGTPFYGVAGGARCEEDGRTRFGNSNHFANAVS